VAHALAATREATVVHVYNTAMISKRVHLYIERSRVLSRSLRAESSEEVGQRSHA
jgi:hypothetical protein